MKTTTTALIALTVLGSPLFAGEIDAQKLYQANCAACHITDLAKMNDKASLIAPPTDEIMMHIKEDFTDRDKAVAFMADYTLTPDPKTSHCASIETFGLMPAQKGLITPEEATAIVSMMFDKYPRAAFVEKENQGRVEHGGMSFEKLDRNKDHLISASEYQLFRAEKNNIDPKKFINTYYFDRLDLNGDGMMDKKEFDIMKAEKRKKRQRR
jgi:hypothetical protein